VEAIESQPTFSSVFRVKNKQNKTKKSLKAGGKLQIKSAICRLVNPILTSLFIVGLKISTNSIQKVAKCD
jgi:hypothetical protein